MSLEELRNIRGLGEGSVNEILLKLDQISKEESQSEENTIVHVDAVSIDRLPISKKAKDYMINLGICTIGQLREWNPGMLIAIKKMDKESLDEIIANLEELYKNNKIPRSTSARVCELQNSQERTSISTTDINTRAIEEGIRPTEIKGVYRQLQSSLQKGKATEVAPIPEDGGNR